MCTCVRACAYCMCIGVASSGSSGPAVDALAVSLPPPVAAPSNPPENQAKQILIELKVELCLPVFTVAV